MRLSHYPFLLFCLAQSCVCWGDAFYEQSFTLSGELSFSEIIASAENQLDIKINLPRAPDSTSRLNYKNQIINLRVLLEAISDHYRQRDLEVTWRRSDRLIEIFEKIDERSAFIPPPAPQSDDPQQNQFGNPSRQTGAPTSQPSTLELLNRLTADIVGPPEPWSPLESPQDLPASSSPPRGTTSSFTITPYPENATAYINDAPPLMAREGVEKFIEWEVRMQGALEQGNISLLQEEKKELDRRRVWLQNRLSKNGEGSP